MSDLIQECHESPAWAADRIEELEDELKVWKPKTASEGHGCPACGRAYDWEQKVAAENERLTADCKDKQRLIERLTAENSGLRDTVEDLTDERDNLKSWVKHYRDRWLSTDSGKPPSISVSDPDHTLLADGSIRRENPVDSSQESGQFTGLKQDPPQKIDHRLDCAYYIGHPCDSGCKSNLVEELEMWAKHNPTDTSIPFGKLFTRAATELKRLEADLVDRIKGERSAWRQVLELRGAADSRLSPSERDWEDALRDKIADLTAENERLTATQKYLCNCLEEVGVDSSAALAAAEGITLPEECPFSGEACDCTDDRGIRAKRCPRTITKHPYGYCPVCLRPGVNRERRPNGNDRCSIGHEYPSAQALYEDKT